MADREQPYDPYIPSGGQQGGQQTGARDGNQRTAALQAVGGLFPIEEMARRFAEAAEVESQEIVQEFPRWRYRTSQVETPVTIA